MKHARFAGRRTAVAVLTIVAVSLATLCVTGGAAEAKTATKTAKCSGTPLKFTAIITKTGPVASPVTGTDVENGIDAALHGINDACTAGVPLKVTVCDDQGDPNASNACGRAAKGDGSLAIVVSAGLRDGAQLSGLPLVLTGGAGIYELTSPDSYPADSPITQMFGSISAASTTHAKSYVMLAGDDPTIHALGDTLVDLAKTQGIKLQMLYFPPDTTDFAPVAAQVSALHPAALGLALTTFQPVLNALALEGLTPKNTPMFTGVALVNPSTVRQMGAKIDGLYPITTAVPAQDTSNPGIRQMLKELKAAGVKTKPADIGTNTVETWAHLHMLADVIGKLSSAERASLTSDSLTKALVAQSPLTSPVVPTVDFNTKAFPSVAALAPLRLFSNQALLVKIVKGRYVPLTAFQDASQPFTLKKKSSAK
jgi:hypothetical protein